MHPIRLVCPQALDIAEYKAIAPILVKDCVPSNWLATVQAYNRLKMSPRFYERYLDYEYLLTYELDCFVFHDELDHWCGRGWDYIGAPWFAGLADAQVDAAFLGVGNSGFSLRRVATMLEVVHTWKRIAADGEMFRKAKQRNREKGFVRSQLAAAKAVAYNNFHWPLNVRGKNEDYFWGEEVPRRFPSYKVAPVGEAKRFSFEVNPSRLYREIGEQLPFGCHKWMTYEPEFWWPLIRSCGYVLPELSRGGDAQRNNA